MASIGACTFGISDSDDDEATLAAEGGSGSPSPAPRTTRDLADRFSSRAAVPRRGRPRCLQRAGAQAVNLLRARTRASSRRATGRRSGDHIGLETLFYRGEADAVYVASEASRCSAARTPCSSLDLDAVEALYAELMTLVSAPPRREPTVAGAC